jgi:hypothetical protein
MGLILHSFLAHMTCNSRVAVTKEHDGMTYEGKVFAVVYYSLRETFMSPAHIGCGRRNMQNEEKGIVTWESFD